ncbi:glycosyltransferase family 2 protein [Odoribacter lunatus]|uniref:glycosyltransferase family 2 protein n=1 Tax=Odoribacter lunatus TaxID=2941335 RepID=UPI002040419B|nr:glycosyltransferase family 2 protein [Odoribacter lunatus]
MADSFKVKVSIIIPVYKVERYIERCLRSVISQTYQGELECILVDDATPDQSMEIVGNILLTYCGNISFKIIRHEQNKGLSAARNTGIKNASGEYLYFLDSDDEITPDAIEKLGALAEKYAGVDMVCGNLYVSELMTWLFIPRSFSEYLTNARQIRKAMLKRQLPITVWNKLIRRDFLIGYNLWFVEGIVHEDEVWNFFVAKNINSLAICRAATYIYYQSDSSITTTVSFHRIKSFIEITDIFIHNIDAVLSRLQRKSIFFSGYAALLLMAEISDKDAVMNIANTLKATIKPLLKQTVRHFRIIELLLLLPFYLSPVFFKAINRHFYRCLRHLM